MAVNKKNATEATTVTKKVSIAEKLRKLDQIADKINKNANTVVCGRLGKEKALADSLEIQWIETPCTDLNSAVGGGFPKGRYTIVAGKSDSGKTSLVLETIGYNMKKNPEFVALWAESENSLNKNYICNTFNIDPDRLVFVPLSKDMAAEGILDIIESYMATGYIDLTCINSLKALTPKKEFADSMSDQNVGLQARLNSKMTRKFTTIVKESNSAFVLISHLTTEIGSNNKNDPYIVSGGLAIGYASSLTLDLRKRSIQESDPIGREDGIKVGVTVKKNHCVTDRFPYVKTEYYAIFGQGIEQYLQLIQRAIDEEVLLKNGSFIRDPDDNGDPKVINGEKMQWQGDKKLRDYLITHEDYFEELKSRISNNNITVLSDEEIEAIKEEEIEMAKHVDEDVIAEVNQK